MRDGHGFINYPYKICIEPLDIFSGPVQNAFSTKIAWLIRLTTFSMKEVLVNFQWGNRTWIYPHAFPFEQH